MEVFITILRDPNTGQWVPIGCNVTEDGAYMVAAEAVDAVSMSMQFSPDHQRRAAIEMMDSIRVVPASLLIDKGHLDG